MSLRDLKAAYAQNRSLALKEVIEKLEAEQEPPIEPLPIAIDMTPEPVAAPDSEPAHRGVVATPVRKTPQKAVSGEKRTVKKAVSVRNPRVRTPRLSHGPKKK